MIWQRLNPVLEQSTYMGWVVTRTLQFERRGRKYYEYTATKDGQGYKSCSWSFITSKLTIKQLQLWK